MRSRGSAAPARITAIDWSAQSSSSSARRPRSSGTSSRSGWATTCGPNCSPNPGPARISRAFGPVPSSTTTGWRVNGQKVWSSAANSAPYGVLLARTGPDSHHGLSMFIVPMDAAGVTVRPLTQIDGESKFNEVFLDNVELDDDALIGEVGQGWPIAIFTLGRERLTLGTQAVAMFKLHERMTQAAREHELLDPVLARRLTRLWARMWLLRSRGSAPSRAATLKSPAFSVLKLMTSETDCDLGDMATEVLGTDACVDPQDNELVHAMLVGRAQTILGGTSEIQRNILGERLLKLPKEPR